MTSLEQLTYHFIVFITLQITVLYGNNNNNVQPVSIIIVVTVN